MDTDEHRLKSEVRNPKEIERHGTVNLGYAWITRPLRGLKLIAETLRRRDGSGGFREGNETTGKSWSWNSRAVLSPQSAIGNPQFQKTPHPALSPSDGARESEHFALRNPPCRAAALAEAGIGNPQFPKKTPCPKNQKNGLFWCNCVEAGKRRCPRGRHRLDNLCVYSVRV